MYTLLAVFELEDVQFVHDQGKMLLLKLNTPLHTTERDRTSPYSTDMTFSSFLVC